jgi:hypothetical protein
VLKRRYVKVLMDLIGELQEQEGGKRFDLRAATFALFGMMNWIYTWYQPKRDLPVAQLIEQMLRLYFFGLINGANADERWLKSSDGAKGDDSFSIW